MLFGDGRELDQPSEAIEGATFLRHLAQQVWLGPGEQVPYAPMSLKGRVERLFEAGAVEGADLAAGELRDPLDEPLDRRGAGGPGNAKPLLDTRDGKIVEGSLHLSGGPAFSDQSIDRAEGHLVNPDLATRGARLGGHVLEEVQRRPAALFVCQHCCAKGAATDGTTLPHAFRSCSHGVLLIRLSDAEMSRNRPLDLVGRSGFAMNV